MRSFEEDIADLLRFATSEGWQHEPMISDQWLRFFEQCVHLWQEVATREALRRVTTWMLAARTLPEVQPQWPPRHAIDFIIHELKQACWDEHAVHLYKIQNAIFYFARHRYSGYLPRSIYKSTDDPFALLPELRDALTSSHPQEINWQKRVEALLYPPPKNGQDFDSLYPSKMSISSVQCKTNRGKRRVPRKRF